MGDKLVPIRSADLARLRDLYLGDWPSNMVGYNTLDTFVRWLEQCPNLEQFNVYSLNGDWSDGMFLCIHRTNWLFMDTLNPSTERLRTALQLLDWSVGLKVASFRECLKPTVIDVIESRRLTICVDDCLMVYHIPRERAAQFDVSCPTNIRLGELRAEHATYINSVWRNKYEGSEELLAQLIELNPSVAAFDGDGKLVGWCLRFETGPMGSLHIDESARRTGLGSLILRAMSRKQAELDMDVFACILPQNMASRGMFDKNGFRHLLNVLWVHTEPKLKSIL